MENHAMLGPIKALKVHEKRLLFRGVLGRCSDNSC